MTREIVYVPNPRRESLRRLGEEFLSLRRQMPNATTDELLRLTMKRVKAVRCRGMAPWAQWHIAVNEFWHKIRQAYPDKLPTPAEQSEANA